MPNWISLVKNNIWHLFCVSWKLNYLSYKNYLLLPSEPKNYPLKISLNLSLTKILQKLYIMHSSSFISLWFLVVNIHRKILRKGFNWKFSKNLSFPPYRNKILTDLLFILLLRSHFNWFVNEKITMKKIYIPIIALNQELNNYGSTR